MKKYLFLIFSICITNIHLYAQEVPAIGIVKGKMIDENKAPLAYASVVLTSLKDSTLQYGTLSDDNGSFIIEAVKLGAYKATLSFLGYKDYVVEKLLVVPPDNIEVDLNTIELQPDEQVLQEVQIVAEKAVMELKADKKVFNVEKSALASGGTATDVLQQIPTVEVDYQGNISVRGSSNLQVFINGRPSGITGANTQAILKSIPANTIESIEIINNPSAKYDAEGEGGIINIVLKKDVKQKGVNGSFNIGYGTKYDANTGFFINVKKNKINYSANYGFNFVETFWKGYNDRKNTIGSLTNYLNSNDYSTSNRINNAISNNLDIQINDKNALTFNTTFNSGISIDEGDVETEFLDSTEVLYNYYVRQYNDHQNDYNTDNTLTYTKTFDKKNQNLIITGNYSFFKRQENPKYFQPSYFLDQSINQTIVAIEEHNVSKDINHTTFGQIDYAHPFEKANGLIEIGAKSAYRNLLNDFTSDSLNRTSLSFERNNGLSNAFRYKEIINASYIIYGGSYKNFSYKAGVRMEHSIIKGKQSVGNVNFTNKYISFFPSAYLAQKFEKGHEISLQYRRSINRPRSRMLNPFGEYSDPFNIRVGNPNLKPVFTESLEFSYVKNFKKVFLTSSLFFKYSKNPYTRYRTLDSNGVATLDFGNLDNSKDVGLELILRTQITKWWNIMTNANLFGNIISGSVPTTGEVDNQNINSFQWNIRMISNMTVWKKTASIQVMWFYRGKRKFLQGDLKPFTFVNIGFKKDFLKDNKASLAVNIGDVFNIMKFRVRSVSDNFSGFVERDWESLRLNVTFTYNFGKKPTPSYNKKKKDHFIDEDNSDTGGM